jgi:hypothetical protein
MRRHMKKTVWIIFDEMDGPVVFTNKRRAKKTYKMWVKKFGVEGFSKPVKYKRKES